MLRWCEFHTILSNETASNAGCHWHPAREIIDKESRRDRKMNTNRTMKCTDLRIVEKPSPVKLRFEFVES